jgi:hypothetical protein
MRSGVWIGGEARDALSARTAAVVMRGEWINIEDGADGFALGPQLRFFASQSSETPVVDIPGEIEVEARVGDFDYYRVAARGSTAARLGPLRAAAVADLTASNSRTPADAQAALGDLRAVPGFVSGQERGPIRAIGGIDLAIPTPVGGYVRSRIRSGAAEPDIADLRDRSNWVTGAELGYLWPTLLGVIDAGFGANTRGECRFYIDLGRHF